MISAAQKQHVMRAVGTVAHNRPFTARDLVEYACGSFALVVTASQVRWLMRTWVRTGCLEVVSIVPFTYVPTSAFWAVIESEAT